MFSNIVREIDAKIDWEVLGKIPTIPIILIIYLFGWIGLGKMIVGLILAMCIIKLVFAVATIVVFYLPSKATDHMINQVGRFLDGYQSRTDPLAFEAREKNRVRDRKFA